MIYEYTSYRTFLKAMLAERSSQNPRFSLRAFARLLELSPAILSQVMNAKKNFSQQMAFQVADKLKLSRDENQYFCLLTQYESEKLPALKIALHALLVEAQKKRRLKPNMPQDMEMETFKLISDWYHIPIIEMTELTSFEFSPANIAKRLGINKNEAEVAIERLERLKLIAKDDVGNYRKTHHDYEFRCESMSSALNTFHKQMLNKALAAITEQKREERLVGSNTFSIDPQLLPEANELIAKFRQDLVALFNTSKNNTEIYHIGLQLFRLSNTEVQS